MVTLISPKAGIFWWKSLKYFFSGQKAFHSIPFSFFDYILWTCKFLLFYFILFYLFIFGCVGSLLLCAGFSLVAASGGYSSLRCAGFSLRWLLLFGARALGAWASAVAARGLCCSAACGVLPDQGSNPRPLHWQADSQPLRHQGSPVNYFLKSKLIQSI